MTHHRFANTAEAAEDALLHLFDDDLSDSEQKARERLIETCRQIADEAEESEG